MVCLSCERSKRDASAQGIAIPSTELDLSVRHASAYVLRRTAASVVRKWRSDSTANDPSFPAGATIRNGITERTVREKVTGIGEFFFQAHDPKALAHWYQQQLGVSLAPSRYEDFVWQQEAGPTVFEPQPQTRRTLRRYPQGLDGELSRRDLDKMVAHLR